MSRLAIVPEHQAPPPIGGEAAARGGEEGACNPVPQPAPAALARAAALATLREIDQQAARAALAHGRQLITRLTDLAAGDLSTLPAPARDRARRLADTLTDELQGLEALLAAPRSAS